MMNNITHEAFIIHYSSIIIHFFLSFAKVVDLMNDEQ